MKFPFALLLLFWVACQPCLQAQNLSSTEPKTEQSKSSSAYNPLTNIDTFRSLMTSDEFSEAVDALNVARNFLELSRSDSSIFHANRALKSLNVLNDINPTDRKKLLSEILFVQGEAQLQKGNLELAMKLFKDVLNLQEKLYGEIHSEVAKTLSCLSEVFRHQSKTKLARDYALRALQIQDQTLPAFHIDRLRSLIILGRMEYWQKKDGPALEYFEQAYNNVLQTLGDQHPEMAIVKKNLALIAIRNQNLNQASLYYDESLTILKTSLDFFHVNIAKMFSSMGTFQADQGNHLKAIHYFDTAAIIYDSLYGRHNAGLVDVNMFISESLIKLHDFKQARLFLQRSASAAKFDLNHPNDLEDVVFVNRLPKLHKVLIDFYDKQYKLNHLEEYSDTLWTVYRQQLNLIEYLFQNAGSDQDRETWAETLPRFAGMTMEHAIERNRPDELTYVFELMEKNKSRFLKYLLLDMTEVNSLLPESAHKKELEITRKISRFEKLLYQETNEKQRPNFKKVRTYRTKLFKLKQQLNKFLSTIRQDYPMYDLIKQNPSIASVTDIQAMLAADETLVEYYVVENLAIFIFVINRNSFHLERLELDFPAYDWIHNFRKSICTYWESESVSDSLYYSNQSMYFDLAHKLHQKLIAPVKDHLGTTLRIVPDGYLNLLPFDALLTQDVDSNVQDYQRLPYVILDYQISFCPSATLFLSLSNNETKNHGGKLLAIAPSFDDSVSVERQSGEYLTPLTSLHWNEEEVRNIRKQFRGKTLVGQQASKKQFLRHAPKYDFIHLATHGKLNDVKGGFSFVAFTQGDESTTDNTKLYANELFRMDLRNEMVTLSACETGLGEIKRGQGLLGLTYGFFSAGSRSVITSLWKVDDEQASILMPRFYEYLKENWDKDAALRRAKLDFIHEEENVHPYFWASYIAAGNMDAIAPASSSIVFWPFLIAAVGMFLLIYYRFFEKKKLLTN